MSAQQNYAKFDSRIAEESYTQNVAAPSVWDEAEYDYYYDDGIFG